MMREAIRTREKQPPGSEYLCVFHLKNLGHNVPMIIKQPVWVSFKSQRIFSPGRMKQLFTRQGREPSGRVPLMKHEEPLGSPGLFGNSLGKIEGDSFSIPLTRSQSVIVVKSTASFSQVTGIG